jgi:hypothetical protein
LVSLPEEEVVLKKDRAEEIALSSGWTFLRRG